MAAYGKAEYWDERYTKDPDPFEWYQRYSGLKEIIAGAGIRTNDHILMVGCGNSTLSEEMYEDGYKQITNVDISGVVIKAMSAKYSGDKYTGLKYLQMNCLDMPEFADGSFPVVIDKGTTDSILCGDASTESVQKMLKEISRVLQPGGVFLCASYGQPTYRLTYLQKEELHWNVKIQTVQKPMNAVSAALSCDEAEGVHYVYICRKEPANASAKNDNNTTEADGGSGGSRN